MCVCACMCLRCVLLDYERNTYIICTPPMRFCVTTPVKTNKSL